MINWVRALFQRYGRKVYAKLPPRLGRRLLSLGYRCLPVLFHGIGHFHRWQLAQTGQQYSGSAAGLLYIDKQPQQPLAETRVALHLHMFYVDLAEEFATYLRNMPVPYDLFVSVADDAGRKTCQQVFAELPGCQALTVQIVPNRGRDIAPMISTFGPQLARYDIIAHLHGKKSSYNQGATAGWLPYLLQGLLGSPARLRRIFGLLQQGHYGLVYPQNFHQIPCFANTWLANRATGMALCARWGIRAPRGYFDFPAGSMFWARTDALRPLLESGLTVKDFPPEAGQTDGTLAHSLERILGLMPQQRGYALAIIADTRHPSWSPWRIEHCLDRPPEAARRCFNNPAVKLIGFDIFDTLLTRPLLDPEVIKQLVAAHADGIDGPVGRCYLHYRAQAETLARAEAGHDVGLEAIYTQLGVLSGLPEQTVQGLQASEQALELASVSARSGGTELYRLALASGRPVVLLSDMFLPPALIEQALRQHGLEGWTELYVSGQVGHRKDDGALYTHVWADQGVNADAFCMVGDSERADVQVPGDRGAQTLGVLKPVEIARALPPMRPVLEAFEHSADPDEQLTLGLVLQKLYAPVHYPELDPQCPISATPYWTGFAVLGPWLAHFAHWLLTQARADGVDRLYFLAREGEFLKAAFDLWAAQQPDAPSSHYLVVSRRAVSVPALENRDDILALARTDFFPNALGLFLHERYGLTPTPARWAEIKAHTGLGEHSTISIRQGRIEGVQAVLEMLTDDILAAGRAERTGLERYLADMGLAQAHRAAVVDVGYGGTIQNYLNCIVSSPIHGYYAMTDERSLPVAARHRVNISACFHEALERSRTDLPAMYQHSFELEKLLSASSPQVVCYVDRGAQEPAAQFRSLTPKEQANRDTQDALRHGALDYMRAAVQVRDRLWPDLEPSGAVARQLYTAFLSANADHPLLDNISLDDHYCGRGVV